MHCLAFHILHGEWKILNILQRANTCIVVLTSRILTCTELKGHCLFVLVSGCARLSCILSFRVDAKLFYRIVSYSRSGITFCRQQSTTLWHPLLFMGTAIGLKHPVSDPIKPSFQFLTPGRSDAHPWASECPDIKNNKWRLNPVWHRMLYSCTQSSIWQQWASNG